MVVAKQQQQQQQQPTFEKFETLCTVGIEFPELRKKLEDGQNAVSRKFQAMLDLLSKLDPDVIYKLSTINTSMEAIALQKAREQADAVSAKFNDLFEKHKKEILSRVDQKLQQKKKKETEEVAPPRKDEKTKGGDGEQVKIEPLMQGYLETLIIELRRKLCALHARLTKQLQARDNEYTPNDHEKIDIDLLHTGEISDVDNKIPLTRAYVDESVKEINLALLAIGKRMTAQFEKNTVADDSAEISSVSIPPSLNLTRETVDSAIAELSIRVSAAERRLTKLLSSLT